MRKSAAFTLTKNWIIFNLEAIVLTALEQKRDLLIIPIALPGLGKTTLGEELYNIFRAFATPMLRIGLDDIRAMLIGKRSIHEIKTAEEYQRAFELARKLEDLGGLLKYRIREWLADHTEYPTRVIYLDNTHITYDQRQRVLDSLPKSELRNPIKTVIVFPNRPDIAKQRQQNRAYQVPNTVIDWMSENFELPRPDEYDYLMVYDSTGQLCEHNTDTDISLIQVASPP